MTEPEITSACGEAMPQRGLDAIALFNAGEYYAQHDAFEVLWMEEVRPVRDLYRAILQVGVAYYHVTEGNRMGALKMLKRSERWLNKLPDVCQGVDVTRLRADSRAVRDALLGASDDLAAFDRSLLKGVRLVADHQ